jgi:hypothetical protein
MSLNRKRISTASSSNSTVSLNRFSLHQHNKTTKTKPSWDVIKIIFFFFKLKD